MHAYVFIFLHASSMPAAEGSVQSTSKKLFLGRNPIRGNPLLLLLLMFTISSLVNSMIILETALPREGRY